MIYCVAALRADIVNEALLYSIDESNRSLSRVVLLLKI